MKKLFTWIVPFFVLMGFFIMLGTELFQHKQDAISSQMLGEPLPVFHLTNLLQPQKEFTSRDLLGHVSLLNVWATWCYACQQEHEVLLDIKENYHVPIYSIDYRDKTEVARAWLIKLGNPYLATGEDKTGEVAIDLGVYGTPETFIIDANGRIRYRHVGRLDQETWEKVLWPLVQKYNKEVTGGPH
ncbi:MAG: hypothetical protein A3E83_04250 [Gammaproteobacteria bacterium RIFCSPHIGHO2_12_FULL_41_20]|nr:MAG: hypothetical protein A3E83_04250 [Gammaproteobacteria bacterium RIFCSPHIGHO2_12_FULL_41_20]